MDIVGKRHWFLLLSLVILLPAVVVLFIPPALNPGIDFSGGAALDIRFAEPVTEGEVRSQLAALGHDNAIIQRSGDREFFIRTETLEGPVGGRPSERAQIEAALRDMSPIETSEFTLVSPLVARETVRNSIIAMLVAAVGILLYITWAFRRVPNPFRYGVCAIVALVHDVLVVIGVFSILGKVMGMEVNAMFVVGVLTVIGYSVNDTIVVFDRIRENIARNLAAPLEESVNTSLLESMSRSLNTSLSTLFVILALLLFGGTTIQSLVLVLLIGVIVGTYSSLFIASTLLVAWEKGELGRLLRRVPLLSRR